MSLSLNQPTPRLNDLLLRGGDDLSPEQKEQALDDILAEFGSAPPRKSSGQPAPAQERPVPPAPSGPLAPKPEPKSASDADLTAKERPALEKRAAPQQTASPVVPAQPVSAPEVDTAPAKPVARSLVIDGIDFSEFLDDAPADHADRTADASVSSDRPAPSPDAAPVQAEAAERPRIVKPADTVSASEKAQKAKKGKTLAPAKPADAAAALDDTAARPQVRRRAKPGSILLRIFAFAAVLATVGFLYTQTLQNRQSSASFDSVRSAVLQTLDLTDMQEADAQMVRRLYGFAPSEVNGCLLYYPATNMGARELLIVKLSDLSQQKSISDAIQTRKQTQMKSFEGYGIEQYDLLSNSIVEVQGNYILFVVHEDAAAAAQAFLKAL